MHEKTGNDIHRLFNPSTYAHAFAFEGESLSGFSDEGTHFYLLMQSSDETPNAYVSKIYQLTNGYDYVISLDESNKRDWENKGYSQKGASLGYAFELRNNKVNGTIPLYRYDHKTKALHLFSILDNEDTPESTSDYKPEQQVLFVCPP